VDHKSIDRMKLDRRLIRRRNWIARGELERALEQLPDVADKAAPIEAGEGAKEAEPTPSG
jgi:hypothetical protein